MDPLPMSKTCSCHFFLNKEFLVQEHALTLTCKNESAVRGSRWRLQQQSPQWHKENTDANVEHQNKTTGSTWRQQILVREHVLRLCKSKCQELSLGVVAGWDVQSCDTICFVVHSANYFSDCSNRSGLKNNFALG